MRKYSTSLTEKEKNDARNNTEQNEKNFDFISCCFVLFRGSIYRHFFTRQLIILLPATFHRNILVNIYVSQIV